MSRTLHKILFSLAFTAAIWLAFGNAVKVVVAASLNLTIDITVCTSMGMLKVSVPADKADQLAAEADKPTLMKHCGNAAFAALYLPPSHPVQLSFATPSTVASWQFVQVLGTQVERNWQNAPPPLRGPPTFASA